MIHPAPCTPFRHLAMGKLRLGWMVLLGAFLSSHGANPKAAVMVLSGSSNATNQVGLKGTLYDYKLRDLRGQDTSLYFPFSHMSSTGPIPGLFANRLDHRGRPVWTGKAICNLQVDSTCPCESPLNAPDRWFHENPAKNAPFPFALSMRALGGDSLGFVDDFFFPLDTLLTFSDTAIANPFFDQQLGLDLEGHNFGFCLELHGKVQPKIGGRLSVTGDDDTWVFVDSQLMVDMGGTHPAQTRSAPLEPRAGGIGDFLSLDIFHCDRQANESMFALATNVPVVPADSAIPEDPVSSNSSRFSQGKASSIQVRSNSIFVQVPAGQSWSLELRDLDGKLQSSFKGAGTISVPWTSPGIHVAQLRSGKEAVTGRFLQHSRN